MVASTLVIAAVVGLVQSPATGCSCIGPRLPKYELNDRYAVAMMQHDAVFVGRVVARSIVDGHSARIVEVEKWWKGPDTTHAEILYGWSSCAYRYAVGDRLVFFAQGRGPFYNGVCSTLPPIPLDEKGEFAEWDRSFPLSGRIDVFSLFDAIEQRFARINAPLDSRLFHQEWHEDNVADMPLGSIVGWVGHYSTGQPVDLEKDSLRFRVGDWHSLYFEDKKPYPVDLNSPTKGWFRVRDLPPGKHEIFVGVASDTAGSTGAFVLGDDRFVSILVNKVDRPVW